MKPTRLFPFLLLLPGLAFCSPTPTPVPTPDPNALNCTMPKPPFLAGPPNPGSWGYTYSYPEERSVTPVVAPSKKTDSKTKPEVKPAVNMSGRMASIQVARGNGVTHVVITRHDMPPEETWKKGQEEYGKTLSETDWTTSAPGGEDPATLAQHFPPIDWIAVETYVGTIPYGGVMCNIFIKDLDPKLKVVDQKTLKIALSKSQYIAFIDTKTHDPVELREAGVFMFFTFQSAPRGLSFPDELVKQIDQGINVQKSMAQRAPRPY